MQTQTAMPYLTFDIAGRTVKVDPDIYYEIFNVRPSRKKYAGKISNLYICADSYPRIAIGRKPGKTIVLSRFIMKPPKRMVVDHINGDRLDNRRENLRIVTRRQNSLNRRNKKTNTGFIGVNSFRKSKHSRYYYCRTQFTGRDGKSHRFCAPDCHENRILAAYVHDKFILQMGEEEYAAMNFENFKYEPFRTFLLETDLNKFKLKNIV